MATTTTLTDEFEPSEKTSHTKFNTLVSNINGVNTLLGNAIVDLAGDNRVLNDPSRETELQVTASGTPDMNVHVNIGVGTVNGSVVQVVVSTAKTISTPTVSNRYTIIQINSSGVLSTKNSAEEGSPTEPDADSGNIKLAAIYLRQNSTAIYNTDQGSHAYIIDRRTFSITRKQIPFILLGTMLTDGGPNSDGYYVGSTTSGFTFPEDVTIEKAFIQAQTAPTGAALILTLRNITDATNDTITLADGEADDEDSTVDLDVDAGDAFAIQVTQVGSTEKGRDLQVILEYRLR